MSATGTEEATEATEEKATEAARPAGAEAEAARPAGAEAEDAVASDGTAMASRVTVTRGLRFELAKLLTQWRIRLLLLACWIAPALFVVAVGQQSTLPTDTLFGRWMHASPWAGPLVVLGFSGSWALPLLTSLVAGDVFAVEDRLGTWRQLLVAIRSPRRIFLAKVVASLAVLLLLVAGLAVSGTVGGLLAVGDRPLVGLDGHLLTSSDAAVRVLLSWVCVLAPTLALAGLGFLGSVTLGRSPMGLLVPALVSLAMALAQMLPLPVAVRVALPTYAFVSWNGLFTSPRQLAPLLIGVVVGLVWAVVATAVACALFVRREFTNPTHDTPGRRATAVGILPLVAVAVVSVVAVAATTSASGSGIEQDKVERSVATAFAHLYRMQTDELNRPAVTEAQLKATAACAKGHVQDDAEGPGNDWRCVVSWHLPGVQTVGQAIYQLDITSDGRFVADGDGPKEVNGYFLVRTPDGDAPNPMWQFDGNVELLSTTPKG